MSETDVKQTYYKSFTICFRVNGKMYRDILTLSSILEDGRISKMIRKTMKVVIKNAREKGLL